MELIKELDNLFSDFKRTEGHHIKCQGLNELWRQVAGILYEHLKSTCSRDVDFSTWKWIKNGPVVRMWWKIKGKDFESGCWNCHCWERETWTKFNGLHGYGTFWNEREIQAMQNNNSTFVFSKAKRNSMHICRIIIFMFFIYFNVLIKNNF